MLKKISVKNYILIDELELDFADGLNIITGETGAGKSILINAIDIAFGAKAGKDVIKSGEEKALIELTLINNKQNLSELFNEYGIDGANDKEIIISREITNSSSRSRVNGSLVNQDFLKSFRELFLDIHSQHQTYSFLQPKYHIYLLDSYTRSTCGELLENYKSEYANYKNMLAELDNLKNAVNVTSDSIDFLKFQINEIEAAEITDINEDNSLKNELEVLQNVEKLKELTGSSYWALSGDDGSILDSLIKIKSNIQKAAETDNELESTESELINAIDSLKDVSYALREYSSSLENDEERINTIQERIFILDKLKRKYGGSLENILLKYNQLKQELNGIEFSTQNVEELEQKISTKKEYLEKTAVKISEERKKYASVLSSLIVEKLEKLELPKVKFEINFEKCELNSNGCDKVEFLISTNVSEDLKPLAKVASGGEISRVMLAIKTIFAQSDNIETVIFDEIDTGISGKTSQSVSEELKELSKYMQIIMITHQAIIASKSDKHFYVYKVQEDTTKINIIPLTDDTKIRALAELAGGEISEETLNFAKTLIK